MTSPAPDVKPPATTPGPAPASRPQPTTTTNSVAPGPPSSFAALVGPGSPSATQPARVAVVSTSTGRPTLSPDRPWVYYSLSGAPGKAGIYRVPFGGGPATRLTWTVGSSLAASPDGSKLLLDARGQPGWRYGLVIRDLASGRWRTAVSFDARGPVPVFGELLLAWPAPRRIRFVARVAGSDAEPGRYRLVGVDPQSGKLTPMGAVLASDPSPGPAGDVALPRPRPWWPVPALRGRRPVRQGDPGLRERGPGSAPAAVRRP